MKRKVAVLFLLSSCSGDCEKPRTAVKDGPVGGRRYFNHKNGKTYVGLRVAIQFVFVRNDSLVAETMMLEITVLSYWYLEHVMASNI
jgi:hypothetical protein